MEDHTDSHINPYRLGVLKQARDKDEQIRIWKRDGTVQATQLLKKLLNTKKIAVKSKRLGVT